MGYNMDGDFEHVRKEIKKLSDQQKTELIKEVCKEMDFPMNAGGQIFLNADFVMQVNAGETSLDELFRAAASRILKDRLEGKPPNSDS